MTNKNNATTESAELKNMILGDENMNAQVETEITPTGFFLVEEEGQSFWEKNKTTVLTASGTATAGFIGGFFVGQHMEKKKRILFMSEVKKTVALFGAAHAGLETIEWGNITLPTASHRFDNADDVKAKIVQDFLIDKKVPEKEKAEWRNLLLEIVTLGELARATQIVTEREIVAEVKPPLATKEENEKMTDDFLAELTVDKKEKNA